MNEINNNVKQENKLSFPRIMLLFFALLAIWGLYVFFLVTPVRDNLGNWGYMLIDESIRHIIWTVPAILLIRHYSSDMLITLREMFTSKVKLLPYVIILLVFLAFNLVASIVINGNITITIPDPITPLVAMFFLAEAAEELVFRGFFLNALLKKTKVIYAHSISSLMFVIIHFPGWIYFDMFPDPLLFLQACASVFALSILFGWTYMKSKNIFVPIFFHIINNLTVILLFG